MVASFAEEEFFDDRGLRWRWQNFAQEQMFDVASPTASQG
jgi:hypothetical protein